MNGQTESKREKRLRQAYEAIDQMELGEREAVVRLALKALLTVRGALNPQIVRGNKKMYSTLVKYIRASNAETLSALVDDVLDNISPQFIPHTTLGDSVLAIYQSNDGDSALKLLQEETIPIVILFKKVYGQYVEPDETGETDEEGES